MIELTNVTVVKSGRSILSNLNLIIDSDSHYHITGKSGSGKTTLLELLAGRVHASQGSVNYDFIEGKSWEDRFWERKKKIQFIPAHAMENLLHLSGDVYYQQRYYNVDNSQRVQVKDILELESVIVDLSAFPASFQIEELLNIEVNRLSNGQLKKVLLLQTLLKHKPHTLLLDYPFEGLDIKSRQELCEFIDFMAINLKIQIIIVDHSNSLPSVINKQINLDNDSSNGEHLKPPTNLNVVKFSQQTESIPIVEMKNVKIQYGDKIILENFNWTVKTGERWALLGKNGSGKTTIFSLIYADHPMAYREEVYLFQKRRGTGESIWDIKDRISYLGPELISYLNPTVISETMFDFILAQHKKINKDKIHELFEYFEAINYAKQSVKTLSSGQLQMMLIINSFLEEKELLLLDEPFQFLDHRQKDQLSRYLQEHLYSNTTLVLITHYEDDIKTWTNLRKQI